MFKFMLVCWFVFVAGVSAWAQSKDKWETIKPGMSEPQLKQIMGDPVRFEPYTTVKYNTFDTSVYWRYPNEKVVVVTNHLVERVEHNREQLLTFIQQHASKKDKDGLIIINHGK
ncbi:MAG: hypothetical protein V4590_14275 [Bacteroidota bacterium]